MWLSRVNPYVRAEWADRVWHVCSISEFERELIRSRVRFGIAAARARGIKMCRPRIRAEDSRIRPLLTEGHPMAAVGEQFGILGARPCAVALESSDTLS
jgi:hypothetical protein